LLYLGVLGLTLAIITLRFALPATEYTDAIVLAVELPLIAMILGSAYRLRLVPAMDQASGQG
jgi:hypothetical protein